MREESRRIADRLEGTLRVPDGLPLGIVVVAHPLPTHGGTMRNPLVAAIARACADRNIYALRFNFRGVGASAGAWSGGTAEVADLDDAVAHARNLAPSLPLGVAGYSFGATTTLRWIAGGGRPDAYALVALPLLDPAFEPVEMPPVPDGAFIVMAQHDQYGSAADLRERCPRADILVIAGVDHFFAGKKGEVGEVVATRLLADLRVD